jgi:hypothetical protein
MKEVFDFITTAKIDAKLQKDILAHEDKMRKFYIIAFIVLIFIFRNWIGYWLKFGVAIPSGHEYKPMNIQSEPIQLNYSTKEQFQKTFTYQSLINDNETQIIPQAHYIISGKAVAFNHDFIFVSKFFDSAALYDLGISWGKLADKKFFNKYVKIYSSKVEMTGSRRLNWTYRSDIPLSPEYINSHISHSHIIPANRNIMAALLKIRLWEDVQIEGDLVDLIFYDVKKSRKMEYYTSLSRSDTDASSRGSGACEAIYATKVRIGNTIYE